MNVTCALSGIQFTCQHFPATVSSPDLAHPIFYLPANKLVSLSTKWVDGELTSTDSYLLFLALLSSTNRIEWRCPVAKTSATDSIVAKNMEKLVLVVSKTLAVSNSKSVLAELPMFSICRESNDLSNVSEWLDLWLNGLSTNAAKYRTATQLNSKMDIEETLQRYIRDSSRDVSTYASTLANWADVAGDFPRFAIKTPDGQHLPINVYWKQLIIRCTKKDSLFSVDGKDLNELLEHCEENIPHGSIYAHSLMKVLRNCKDTQRNFFGSFNETWELLEGTPSKANSNDTTISSTATSSATISEPTSVEIANRNALLASAPSSKPERRNYSTLALYLKATIAYDMAHRYTQTN